MKTKQRILSVLMILALVVSMTAVFIATASADVSKPSAPTISSTTASVTANYTAMTFSLGKGLVQNDIISMTFPSGTQLPKTSANATYGSPATALAPSLINQGGTSGTSNVLLLTANATIPAGTLFTVQLSDSLGVKKATNPKAGIYTYSVFTSKETTPVASSSYTIKGIKITGGATATPYRAASGTTMTITGAGYTAGQSLDVKRGTTVIASTTVASNGTFTTTFSQTAGAITATDGAGLTYNTLTTTYAPSISLSSTSGLVGSTTIVTGTNFTAPIATGNVATITVALVGVSISPYTLVAADVVSTTSFKKSFTIPSTTTGVKQVKVTIGSESAVANFTATPQVLTLTPSTSTKGSTVTASGTGWKAAETITVAFGATSLATTTSGTDGTFSVTFKVPTGVTTSTTGASNTITATGSTSAAADTATLKVTGGLMAISPISGIVGTSVAITGTGMDANSVHTVNWTDAVTTNNVVLGTAISNSTGALSLTVTIPSATIGAGTLSIYKAATLVTTKTFTVKAGTVVVPVADALTTISGKFTKVWAFNALTQEWLLYDTDTAAPSTLTTMTTGQGYWLEVSEAVTLLFGGNSYSLSIGWNLIGWLG